MPKAPSEPLIFLRSIALIESLSTGISKSFPVRLSFTERESAKTESHWFDVV